MTVPNMLFSCGRSPNGMSGETALNASAKTHFTFSSVLRYSVTHL